MTKRRKQQPSIIRDIVRAIPKKSIKENVNITNTRNIIIKLRHYENNKQPVKFRTKVGIEISGLITKVKAQPLFGYPFVLVEAEDGFETKTMLSEINVNTIVPSTMKIDRKRKSIPKSVKKSLWRKYFGNSYNGECYVCKDKINKYHFDSGHVVAVANGGDNSLNNLRPICRTCNSSMGTQNLEEFKVDYF